MKNINKNGFSLVIWIWLVFLISMLVLYIVEYMFPFSRNVKWIENSSISYYQANSWLEETLYFINRNEIWTSTWLTLTNDAQSFWYELVSTWTMLPPAWEWNSWFDQDWNIIAKWKPIQLQVWDWKPNSFAWVNFYFRVPDLNLNNTTDESLSGTSLPIINWQLSSNTWTLNASSYITASDINSPSTFSLDLDSASWKNLMWSIMWFGSSGGGGFYSSNCWVWSKCTLKISIIDDLVDSWWTKVPYLEWRANFSWTTWWVALRYARLELEWKSYWFRRVLNVKIPQLTTIEAFDFTVFQ